MNIKRIYSMSPEQWDIVVRHAIYHIDPHHVLDSKIWNEHSSGTYYLNSREENEQLKSPIKSKGQTFIFGRQDLKLIRDKLRSSFGFRKDFLERLSILILYEDKDIYNNPTFELRSFSYYYFRECLDYSTLFSQTDIDFANTLIPLLPFGEELIDC